LCETDKKPNVLPPADRAGISRRRLLGSTSLVAASVAASFALPRTASSQGVNVLPTPEPPFQGKIGRTVRDSTPDFPKGVEAPAGAPNVLLILTDDVGFGATSTFGAPIRTPNFERIADTGLRYNIGSLVVDRMADFIVVRGDTATPAQSVVNATPADVALVVIGGAPVYGDEVLMNQLIPVGTKLEPLEVCGSKKFLNLAGTYAAGKSLVSVEQSVSDALAKQGFKLPSIECD
jgi:hypothetical protein